MKRNRETRAGAFWLMTLAAVVAQGCGSSRTAPLDGGDGGGSDSGGEVADSSLSGDAGTADGAIGARFALTPVRRTSYRRITSFPRGADAKFISDARISADGSRIIFGTFAGTYTIASDGTNLVTLSTVRNNGHVDISADGKKVVWYENSVDGFVAASDGSGKIKLPGTLGIKGLRMTAAGDQIYQVAPDAGGLLKLPADGTGMKVVMATADVAKANGVDANGNHWRGVMDISDDGSKVVFTFLWDAFAMTGDGAGLKQLTQFLMPENRTLKLVRISGDGTKVAWNVEDGLKSAVTIGPWGGGASVVYTGITYSEGYWMHMPGTGATAALGSGLRLLDTGKVAPYDAIDSGSNSIPLGKPVMVTLTGDARRACIVIEGPESTDQGRPHQIVVVDFEPPTNTGAPTIAGTATTLKSVPNDGSKAASIFATVTDAEVSEVNTVALRGGLRLGATPWLHWPLEDTGERGDSAAKDGVHSTNTLTLPTDTKVAPGPFTLRFVAANKAGHVLMVDTEGLEAHTP